MCCRKLILGFIYLLRKWRQRWYLSILHNMLSDECFKLIFLPSNINCTTITSAGEGNYFPSFQTSPNAVVQLHSYPWNPTHQQPPKYRLILPKHLLQPCYLKINERFGSLPTCSPRCHLLPAEQSKTTCFRKRNQSWSCTEHRRIKQAYQREQIMDCRRYKGSVLLSSSAAQHPEQEALRARSSVCTANTVCRDAG